MAQLSRRQFFHATQRVWVASLVGAAFCGCSSREKEVVDTSPERIQVTRAKELASHLRYKLDWNVREARNGKSGKTIIIFSDIHSGVPDEKYKRFEYLAEA